MTKAYSSLHLVCHFYFTFWRFLCYVIPKPKATAIWLILVGNVDYSQITILHSRSAYNISIINNCGSSCCDILTCCQFYCFCLHSRNFLKTVRYISVNSTAPTLLATVAEMAVNNVNYVHRIPDNTSVAENNFAH